MHFSLSLPGNHSPEFHYDWGMVSVEHSYQLWTVSAYSQDYAELIGLLELERTEEDTWINFETGITLKTFPDYPDPAISHTHHTFEADIDIPFEADIENYQIECHTGAMSFDQEEQNLNITFTVTLEQCHDLELRPLDTARDVILVDDEVIGCIWKGVQIGGPYSALQGMVNTTAHDYIFYPTWPALPSDDIHSLDQFWETSKDTEFVNQLDQDDEKLKYEFIGIDSDSLGNLLYGLSTAVEDTFGEAYEEETHMYLYHHDETEDILDEDVVEEIQNLQSILACALFFGSRFARNFYLKYSRSNISLENNLHAKELSMFVDGMIAKRRIDLDICEDERKTRVESVPNGLSLRTGNILYNEASEQDWDILDVDEVWGWMCWAFDLGVKYQMLRLDKTVIEEWIEEEKHRGHMAEQLLQDFIDEEEN